MTDAASRAQNRASDPATSTWLGANAGSGKTRVLTDRVARLLLDGVRPERILCLTYTKAAAMEMQNRLFQRLGDWAMKEEGALIAALRAIGVPPERLEGRLLNRARTLFARAIEAPGGLKIQTIHSFCGAVLRRFPLEARVSPAFAEIDERVQTRLLTDLLDALADRADGARALDLVAPHLSADDSLLALARAVAGQAEALQPPASWEEICAAQGIAPDLTEDAILARVFAGDEAAAIGVLRTHLDPGTKTHVALDRKLAAIRWDSPTPEDLAVLEGVFLVQTGPRAHQPKVDDIANKAVRDRVGAAMAPINALMERVARARALRTGLMTARRTQALHGFAEVFLPAYAAAKEARGWLDFDDLIDRTRALLRDPRVAQWVLYRLDGGIDHILVDEAQDTAPRQWDIVERLTEDFAAGAGARGDVARTIFVVGDKKQSIYSFQGADPAEFDRMRAHFETRLAAIGAPFQDAALVHSFRSAPPILALVDRVAGGAGGPGLGGGVGHVAFFDTRPGRVDLWPALEPAGKARPPSWDDPQDLVSEDHHTTVLARTLAARIGDMLAHPPEIEVGGLRRALRAEDILILVRARSALFRKLIAEMKAAGLPVAGVDRAQLTAPLAVKDLLALCRFLATPEDDLSLACVLRSPLCGLDEGRLHDLAAGRAGYLWAALRARAEAFPEVHAMLSDLRDQAEFLRPYDLLERALLRHDGRRRLIARLGPEAEDAIDAMLAQALGYEATEVPTLTGFIGWLEAGDVQVKRDLSRAQGQIRVMTVHGAKGLEAPVVILPDCAQPRGGRPGIDLLVPGEGADGADGGPVIWPPAADDQSAAARAAKALADRRAAEERNRLLYVALTRAESWLIVAAAGQIGRAEDASWYAIVRGALQEMGAAPLAVAGIEGAGLRLETGDWTEARPERAVRPPRAVLPDWAARPAPRPPRDRPVLSPSDLGGAKTLPGEPGGGGGDPDALRRGRLVHLLLEHLPRLPRPAWAAAAPGIAALEAGEIGADDLAPLLEEAAGVLTDPAFAPLFAAGTLAEVEITGDARPGGPAPDGGDGATILGKIDRLVVTPEVVTAIDFKTNRIVPAGPGQVPEGILRQMGAYAAALAQVYPGRRIETAILWSRGPRLMTLPHDLVSAAFARAGQA